MLIKNFHNLIFIFLFFILGGVSSLDGKTLEKEDIDLLNKVIDLGNRANIGFDQIIFIEKQREDSYPITIYNSDGGEVLSI